MHGLDMPDELSGDDDLIVVTASRQLPLASMTCRSHDDGCGEQSRKQRHSVVARFLLALEASCRTISWGSGFWLVTPPVCRLSYQGVDLLITPTTSFKPHKFMIIYLEDRTTCEAFKTGAEFRIGAKVFMPVLRDT